MKPIELFRDALARQYPDRTIFVNASARHQGLRNWTEYSVCILPGFNFEECQSFTGGTLADCLRKIEALTGAAALNPQSAIRNPQ